MTAQTRSLAKPGGAEWSLRRSALVTQAVEKLNDVEAIHKAVTETRCENLQRYDTMRSNRSRLLAKWRMGCEKRCSWPKVCCDSVTAFWCKVSGSVADAHSCMSYMCLYVPCPLRVYVVRPHAAHFEGLVLTLPATKLARERAAHLKATAHSWNTYLRAIRSNVRATGTLREVAPGIAVCSKARPLQTAGGEQPSHLNLRMSGIVRACTSRGAGACSPRSQNPAEETVGLNSSPHTSHQSSPACTAQQCFGQR